MRLSHSLKWFMRVLAALLLVCMATGCLHTGKKPFASFISKPNLDMTADAADAGAGWGTPGASNCSAFG